MNILITGGNGYIAQSIYKHLKDLYSITLVNRSMFDLTDAGKVAEWFDDKFFDVVIHTAIAGGSRLKPEDASVIDLNLKMYYNLLDNKQHFSRFINIGSGAELYATHTPYGLSKQVIRTSLLEKDEFYNIRVFAVFDENELSTRFIKANILRYINKEPIMIFGDKRMDFFYMNDFVKVISHYINTKTDLAKEFDCTYDHSYSLSEIASLINSLDSYHVDITTTTSEHAVNYIGTYANTAGLSFDGLHVGIQNVYRNLLCKE